MSVGPGRVETQSTAISVLMMGQVLYLLNLVPTLELSSPEAVVRSSMWAFQVLMAIHWWFGAQFFLQHLGPAKSLPELYFFFAMLGMSWVPAFFIHDMSLYMFVFSGAFALAYLRYQTLLPGLAAGGVREYVRLKRNVEIAGLVMLVAGGLNALVVTEPRLQALLAPGAVLIQVAMIGYCVRRLYPLVEVEAVPVALSRRASTRSAA